MIHQTYAHIIHEQRPARFPTRFEALDALLRCATATGTTIERHDIPTDSGLDAIAVFSDTSDDQFLIMRLNADTYTITRKPRMA